MRERPRSRTEDREETGPGNGGSLEFRMEGGGGRERGREEDREGDEGKVTRCEMVVCWAATEARLVKVRYTETGGRASGMPQILYRGRGKKVEMMELVGVGRSTGVGFRGNLIPRRARLEDKSQWEKGGEGKRGGVFMSTD
jgi:hypothetical protein